MTEVWPGADLGEGRLEGRPRSGRGMNTGERAVQGRGEVGESQEELKRPQRGNEPWTRSKATRVLVWCQSSWPEAAADPGEAQAVRMGAASVGPVFGLDTPVQGPSLDGPRPSSGQLDEQSRLR